MSRQFRHFFFLHSDVIHWFTTLSTYNTSNFSLISSIATLKTPANKNIENNDLNLQLVSRYFLNPSWSHQPSLGSEMLTSTKVFPGDIQFK